MQLPNVGGNGQGFEPDLGVVVGGLDGAGRGGDTWERRVERGCCDEHVREEPCQLRKDTCPPGSRPSLGALRSHSGGQRCPVRYMASKATVYEPSRASDLDLPARQLHHLHGMPWRMVGR